MDEPSTSACEREQAGADVDPVDIQRLLSWYFDVQHPGRAHITSRGLPDPILGWRFRQLGSAPCAIGTSTRLPHSVHEPS